MHKIIEKLLFLVLILTTFSTAGFNAALKKQKFLTPEEAFKASAIETVESIDTTVELGNKIHVYENSLSYRVVGNKTVELEVQKPKAHADAEGEMVYEKEIIVSIPKEEIESKVVGNYTLEINFQGCSAAGICYEPMTKKFHFESAAKLGTFDKISAVISEGNPKKIVDFFLHESPIFIIVIFLLLGVNF